MKRQKKERHEEAEEENLRKQNNPREWLMKNAAFLHSRDSYGERKKKSESRRVEAKTCRASDTGHIEGDEEGRWVAVEVVVALFPLQLSLMSKVSVSSLSIPSVDC